MSLRHLKHSGGFNLLPTEWLHNFNSLVGRALYWCHRGHGFNRPVEAIWIFKVTVYKRPFPQIIVQIQCKSEDHFSPFIRFGTTLLSLHQQTGHLSPNKTFIYFTSIYSLQKNSWLKLQSWALKHTKQTQSYSCKSK